ncbi:MAG: hypothetical protein KGO48_01475 [Alphaproteobacteria bacterium]|nr:hypothetical protein [Alphaproteobacteria bacterium]
MEFAGVPVTGAPPRFAVSAAATEVVPAGPLVTTRLFLASNCEHKNRICDDKMSFAAKLAPVLLLARDVSLTRDLPSPLPPSAVPDPIVPDLPELLLSVLFVPSMPPGNPPVFMPVLPNPVPGVAPAAPAPGAAPAPVAPPAPPVCAKAGAAKAMAEQAIAATSVFLSFAISDFCVPPGSTPDNGSPGVPFRGQAQAPPCSRISIQRAWA